ncbi:MAG: hypothetical protein ABSF34_03650 [Verrucomicrobiota bacterium]
MSIGVPKREIVRAGCAADGQPFGVTIRGNEEFANELQKVSRTRPFDGRKIGLNWVRFHFLKKAKLVISSMFTDGFAFFELGSFSHFSYF